MNVKCKWALALAPLFLTGCNDKFAELERHVASSGDEVQFALSKGPATRTMYQDEWDILGEEKTQQIYWGNYVDGEQEYINIYCPEAAAGRGFAKYHIESYDQNVASTVAKVGDAGVQWGAKGIHHFYAFYPADRAGESLIDGKSTILASVDTIQNPVKYKYKSTEANSELKDITSFEEYAKTEYDNDNNKVGEDVAKRIYGLPDMNAAVMVARQEMTEDQFGHDVPLDFKVLADVLDLTFNGPVTPNALGGNANNANITRQFIKIQSVTIDVVTVPEGADGKNPEDYEIDNTTPISGSFNLDMSEGKVTKVTDGRPTVRMSTSLGGGTPTLFVRGAQTTDKGDELVAKLDQLRLRAFLIPGQITAENMARLRVHIETDCGDFYKMLATPDNFVTGSIHPVKFGYFYARGEEFDLSKWVGQLDPNIYLSELSIPGAWHASNVLYQGDGVSFSAMYKAGVRAFEVHTINGTIPYTSTDFKTELTSENVSDMEFHDYHLSEKVTDDKFGVSTDGNESWDGEIVTGTGKTVTETRTITYNQLPKFALRLYRTRNVTDSNPNPEESLSDALISLAAEMNESGFMIYEFGWENPTYYDNGTWKAIDRNVKVPCKTITATQRRTKSVATLTGTGTSGNIIWDTDKVFSDADSWETIEETSSYTDMLKLNGREPWCIAMNSCINRLRGKANPSTGKPILYEQEITAETTIGNVQGQVIFKINTNDKDNEQSMAAGAIGWEERTPALFSRWVNGSESKPVTVNLQWGSGVAPQDKYDTGAEPTTYLRWCFSEQDNIGNIENRRTAIDNMNGVAASNYADGLHRTFYETSLGGYLNGSQSASNCLAVAKELHPYVLKRLGNPTRQQVPLGLVFMNYVIAPDGQEETYKSSELIRAIINNNKAFRLHRKGDEAAPEVQQRVNSHFTNNSQNPLK